MSPIEHYFENLLTIGSDIKGEPNKNVLSKEVQEAIEECAYYIKYNKLLDDTKADDMVVMLEELKSEIEEIKPLEPTDDEDWQCGCFHGLELMQDKCLRLIQQKISSLKNTNN